MYSNQGPTDKPNRQKSLPLSQFSIFFKFWTPITYHFVQFIYLIVTVFMVDIMNTTLISGSDIQF